MEITSASNEPKEEQETTGIRSLSDKALRLSFNFAMWEGDDIEEARRYQAEIERRDDLEVKVKQSLNEFIH